MKKYILTASVIFIVSVSCCQENNSVQTIRELKDSVEKIIQQEHITGLMMGITTRDSVIFSGGFGFADLSSKRPVDKNTLFRMGSVTKMFVSLAILKLTSEGRLHLNDELKKMAPEVPFNNKWENTDPVLLVHLLEHSTGFDDMKLNKMYTLTENKLTGLNNVLEQKSSLKCRWKPGERFAYSNPNYAVLGYLVEKFSGKPCFEYMKELILLPLGITNSNFNTKSLQPGIDTKEYIFQDGKTKAVPSVTLLNGPAGSLWSGADDMLKFIQLFLRDGAPLFSENLVTEMETVHSTAGARQGLKTGYGLANRLSSFETEFPYYGHDGLIGTCFSTCNYNRKAGVGFIIASNSNDRNERIQQLVTSFIEQNIIVSKNFSSLIVQPLDVKAIEPYLGRYQNESPRNEISAFKDKLMDAPEFYIKDGRLFYKALIGPSSELVQTAPFTFAWKGNNSPLIVFTKNTDGKKVMVRGGTYFEKISGFWGMAKRYGLVLALLLTLLSFGTAFISLIGLGVKKTNWKDAVIRLLPAAGTGLLIAAVLKLLAVEKFTYSMYQLGTINSVTVTIFLGTLLFAILSLLTFFFALKNFRATRQIWFAVYFLLTGISMVVITLVLWQAGWIGLRTWAM
jgi:CubicO group peptidase (beta-lactamase class C family)